MDRMYAALAALLHDVGKFWQRAASSRKQPLPPGYEQFSRDDYGAHGAHATWSAAFVEQYVPEAFRHAVLSPVLYHHNPQDGQAQLVALADRLASSERLASRDVQPQSQASIFCQLGGNPPDPMYWPLRPLALEAQTLFPLESAPSQSETRAAYQELWAGFQADADKIRHYADLPTYIESLQNLLHRYTWSVPAAYYGSAPDISLYDHSRVTAALAACLADYPEQTIQRLLDHQDNETVVANLLEGDISGVQRFIYTITSRGAARGLRGRSLYLQLLTEATARFLLRQLRLPITNLLYIGGGHFYLLIPAGSDAKLQEIRQHLDSMLLTHHRGDLYLALGTAKLCTLDFGPAAFSGKWREVGQAVGADKRRRFADLPEGQQIHVFAPYGHGGNEEKECQVCHAEREDVVPREVSEDGEAIRKCELCASLEDLGQKSGRSAYLVIGETAPELTAVGSWQSALKQLGVDIGLAHDKGWTQRLDAAPVRVAILGMSHFPQANIASSLGLNCPAARGLRYTVNVTPRMSNGDVATFTEMQQASHGIKRLGVLRMDVDDLGHLFAHGFRHEQKGQATIARVASLSSALSVFFEGWIGKLCEQVNERREIRLDDGTTIQSDLIYSIYSGGDDLFIVGAWDVLPRLAQRISEDFRRFASNNRNVHVSAGITLHGGKYPLYQAAHDAEHALDASKDREGKNAITFLGQTVSWTGSDPRRTWQAVVELRDELRLLVDDPKVGRSLLHVLMQLHKAYLQKRQELEKSGRGWTKNGSEQVLWGPWMWRGAYLLTRLAERAGKGSEAQSIILKLRDRLSTEQFRGIEVVGLAARWAEALTRSEKQREED